MKTGQGVLLLDHFDEGAQMLEESFRLSGFEGPAIVLSEETALPEGVLSIYRLAAEDGKDAAFPGAVRRAEAPSEEMARSYRLAHAGWTEGHARYFDQIEVPDFWEISADSAGGKVFDESHLRAKIFYAKGDRGRIVSDVDWFDERGRVRFTDHYDLAGRLISRTTFSEKGERFCCSWFDNAGRERIVENYVCGDIIVTRGGTTHLFRNRTEMAAAVLEEAGLGGERIFYNSLSWPLFVSERLEGAVSGNVLFWQEGPRADIPGNMQMILDGRSRTEKILVQDGASYRKLAELGAGRDFIAPFGFAYAMRRENQGSRNILICTNSDQIEGLDQLVDELSDMQFHIVAVTEMSEKLMGFGAKENVLLYPAARKRTIEDLFGRCDWYLDINYGSEIVSAVRRAFLESQLILGFSDTLHRRRYVAGRHIFKDAQAMAAFVRKTAGSQDAIGAEVGLQEREAMAEGTERYRELFVTA